MAVYINDEGDEIEVGQDAGRASLEALGWTLLRSDEPIEVTDITSGGDGVPDVPREIVVDFDESKVLVDGKLLPYLLGAAPVIDAGRDGIASVWVELLADQVTQIGAAPIAPPAPAGVGNDPAAEPAPTTPEPVAAAPWLGELDDEARATAEAEKVADTADEKVTETAAAEPSAPLPSDAQPVAEPAAAEADPEPETPPKPRRSRRRAADD